MDSRGLVLVDATSQNNTAVRGGPLPSAHADTGGWTIHLIADHSIVEVCARRAAPSRAAPCRKLARRLALTAPCRVRARRLALTVALLLAARVRRLRATRR